MKKQAVFVWNKKRYRVFIDGRGFHVSPPTEKFLDEFCRDEETTVYLSTKPRVLGTRSHELGLLKQIVNEWSGEPLIHYYFRSCPWDGTLTICPEALLLMFDRIPKTITISTDPPAPKVAA